MKINISAELTGKEASDYLLRELQSQGVTVVEGSMAKCLVVNKKDEEVEIDLNKVRFVFSK